MFLAVLTQHSFFHLLGIFHYCFQCTVSGNHPLPFIIFGFWPQGCWWLDIFWFVDCFLIHQWHWGNSITQQSYQVQYTNSITAHYHVTTILIAENSNNICSVVVLWCGDPFLYKANRLQSVIVYLQSAPIEATILWTLYMPSLIERKGEGLEYRLLDVSE